jgi:hypothetical protein
LKTKAKFSTGHSHPIISMKTKRLAKNPII